MRLYHRELGATTGPPVVFVHGLFGSSANWMGIARQLEGEGRIILPDLRNHGRSPHDGRMDYLAMAADLLQLLDDLGIREASFVGHSMGGKAAMWLALEHPERVQRLMSVDMAPVAYEHDFSAIIDAMKAVDLTRVALRRDADAQLAIHLSDPRLRQYLLQNLIKTEAGWRWRIHLPALEHNMGAITGFPDPGGRIYPGTAWFVYGTASTYVTEREIPEIRRLFPQAHLRAVPGAGHWLYAERPVEFVGIVRNFLH